MERIRAITAYTDRKGSVELAAEEVLRQLDLPNTLCRNAVGLLACHGSFVDLGIVAALCKRLPFDVVGISCPDGTTNNGIPGLALGVLTSDHVLFESALSAPLQSPCTETAHETYAWAAAGKQEQPGLLLALGALPAALDPEEMLGALEDASGGMPIFGAACARRSGCESRAGVLYQGEWYEARIALLLLYGAYTQQAPVESLSAPEGGYPSVKTGVMPLHVYLQALGMGRMPEV